MTFLIVLLAIWAFGFLFFRVFLPWLLTRYVKKMTKNMNMQSGNVNSSNKKKEGEINIDYIPNSNKDKQNDVEGGEYVDFEEID